MTKKTGMLVVMGGMVTAGLALGGSASAKTIQVELLGPSGLTGETYNACPSGAQIFAVGQKFETTPPGPSLYACEVTAFTADAWFTNNGCHPSSTRHRAILRTASTVLAVTAPTPTWTNGAQAVLTVNSRVNNAGACANNSLIAFSLGS